ncbi:MAG TPA: DNA polymerase I [Deltaproteobacteria bacterium]|nr:MAG: DNA polymerase I [Deltaproteobacteria bacterium GWA2_45_12]HBF11957.1 DNA polymerase I [Deltaproteobacteria bacterium]
MSKKLFLVDISSYVFRAYYAVKALKTSKGIATNATYGVINMLLKLIREKKPDYLVIVFDSPIPSFRKEIYTAYKANREAPPEDLPHQFEHIKEFVKKYPLPSLQINSFEADDIIATLVSLYRKGELSRDMQLKKEDLELVIVSADKDLMQLVGNDVVMYDSMKEKIIGIPEVKERFGVGPEKVLDVLSLSGDASDNIPGVDGVGEKTATKLLLQWGSLEAVLDHASEIKGKLGQTLITCREQALLSKKLVVLKDDLALHPDWKCFELAAPHTEDLNALYKELELWSLVKKGESSETLPVNANAGPKKEYHLILTVEALKGMVSKLVSSKEGFSFDTETTGLDPLTCKLVGMSFSIPGGEAFYVPVGHLYLGCPEQISLKDAQEILNPVFSNESLLKYGQNVKYDAHVLRCAGFQVEGIGGDTMLASYILSPESPHNLDHLASQYLQYTTLKYDEVVGKGKTFDSVDVDKACRYSAEDADVTMRLVPLLHQKLKEENLWNCYQNIELPLIDVLLRMEETGVLVDIPFLKKLATEFCEKLKQIEKEVHAQAGLEFNLQSPKQVGDVLFNKLLLPVQRKTKTGYSTDVDVLETLSALHPLPKLLLQYRTLSKLLSTYVEQLLELVHPQTGRVHTSFNQTVAATGRLSSSDPNLQNIPIRTEEGKRIRHVFIVPSGYKMLSADYSQIELRLLAAFSQEKALIDAFKNNRDIHALTATRLFNASLPEVTSDMRARAKTVNFGVIYGQSPFGLSQQLGIPQAEAKKYIETFFAQYPRVLKYREEVLKGALATGEVRTWQGRRRVTADLASRNAMVRANAERMAFNTVFQGSAADLIKVAMIRIHKILQEKKLGTKMLIQVHDELLFEVPESELAQAQELIKFEMENAVPCDVPLKVDVSVGTHWGECG